MNPSSAQSLRFDRTAVCLGALGLSLGLGSAALAAGGECGASTPEYSARRAISVPGGSLSAKVYVSGDKIREESSPGGRRIVTIRLLGERKTVTWDEDAKTGSMIAMPAKSGGAGEAKIIEEPSRGGGKIRRAQILQDGKWLDVSVTSCGANNVMTRQTFTSVNPAGAQIKGTVTQSAIKVGPVDPALFAPPGDVKLK